VASRAISFPSRFFNWGLFFLRARVVYFSPFILGYTSLLLSPSSFPATPPAQFFLSALCVFSSKFFFLCLVSSGIVPYECCSSILLLTAEAPASLGSVSDSHVLSRVYLNPNSPLCFFLLVFREDETLCRLFSTKRTPPLRPPISSSPPFCFDSSLHPVRLFVRASLPLLISVG